MSRQIVTLIFDIGKTTKKVLVFDSSFHTLEEQTKNFPEVADDEGFPCEDLRSLTEWLLQNVDHYLQHPEFLVTHINVSAYGASLVHLDQNGEVLYPFYNYLKPFPEEWKLNFNQRYNQKNNISIATASPFLGLLNAGLQLYWLKHAKPQKFSAIATTLHFPQYFTYLLTKIKFTENTSLGCHTMMWDFSKGDYHSWIDYEGLRKLFPPVRQADATIVHLVNGKSLTVGIGVHDSSAALMPYLVTMQEKFLLLSTGTWNICFNPFNGDLLTVEELNQDCLCFLTYDNRQVKASRIFLGHEHELQQQALASYFNVAKDAYQNIPFDEDLYCTIKSTSGFKQFKPLGMQGTGPFISNTNDVGDNSTFNNFAEAQHHLIHQLVVWQKISIDLIDPQQTIRDLIVVGGFTKSKMFIEIMKKELPGRRILLSDQPRAAALGAAWLVTGKSSYHNKSHLLNVLPA